MESFEQAYDQYEALVRGFLIRLCGDSRLAEDLTQETFYQAMRHWKEFRGQCAVQTWLCTIGKRLYYSYCRKPAPLPLHEAISDGAPDPADRLADSDRRMTAFRQLHDLPEPYREVFTLRTFGELSHGELGEIFGKSESWSRATYYRARQMLRRMAEEEKKNETDL